jgi:RNA polymerase sigma-70 factor (ECF subfamily)
VNTTPSPDGLSPDAERDAVDRARLGDQEALGLLYDAYLPRLYRYCLSRVGNETDAEDLAEEIFLKVLGAIEGFHWQPAERAPGQEGSGSGNERIPFGAWLFRIAHNHVVSFHRRAATRGPALELTEGIRDAQRGPEELTETKITVEEVFTAVRELPDAQRDVILLRFASGLSVAETAATLGKNETNVKVLQHKGVQRLKRILAAASEQRTTKPEQISRRAGPRRLHIR